jgi:hypothetical protein
MERTEGAIESERKNRNLRIHARFEGARMKGATPVSFPAVCSGCLPGKSYRSNGLLKPLFDPVDHLERLPEIAPVHEIAIEGFDRGADEGHLSGLFFRDERDRFLRKIDDRKADRDRSYDSATKGSIFDFSQGPEILDPFDFPVDPDNDPR